LFFKAATRPTAAGLAAKDTTMAPFLLTSMFLTVLTVCVTLTLDVI
jgi:hypothetical protein